MDVETTALTQDNKPLERSTPPAATAPVYASAPSTRQIGAVRRRFSPWNDPAIKPMIEFKGLCKSFGAVTALDHVNFHIYPREFFALLGPSGCGKTTLLRILAGFENPTSGQVLLDGQDITAMPPEDRPVNMMFQSYALFPHLNVEDNIAFGLRRAGMTGKDIAVRVGEMLQLVQLKDYGKRRLHQLSGGQKQRVALARALAKRPKVLLLDEPLAALDKNLRQNTQFELMTIQEQLGLTFIIVTHDQEEAMTVSDRIAVMDHGKVAQIATPAQVYEQPGTRFVAKFIGEINILEGAVAETGANRMRMRLPTGESIAVNCVTPRSVDAPLSIAIRPEKISMTRENDAPLSPNELSGEVTDIGYLGGLSIYRVKIASSQVISVTAPNRSRLVEAPIYWGDKVRLHIPEDAAIVLQD
ncbi:MAG: ABC transporter ATP-binding protein [Chitinophagales bacterium]|nr:ABC transporter ATP-binding protein [Hyphomicrobiales bacterium]